MRNPTTSAFDVLDRAEVHSRWRAMLQDDVGGIVRRAVGVVILLRVWIERSKDGELHERGISRNRSLHGFKRHRLERGPEWRALLPERRFKLIPT